MSDALAGFEDYSMPNWDGDGAEPITAATIAAARFLVAQLPSLAETNIAPGADGTIGFEWRGWGGRTKIFLDVKATHSDFAKLSGSVRFPEGTSLQKVQTTSGQPPASSQEISK